MSTVQVVSFQLSNLSANNCVPTVNAHTELRKVWYLGKFGFQSCVHVQFVLSCVWMTMALHVYPKKLHINKGGIPVDLYLNTRHV